MLGFWRILLPTLSIALSWGAFEPIAFAMDPPILGGSDIVLTSYAGHPNDFLSEHAFRWTRGQDGFFHTSGYFAGSTPNDDCGALLRKKQGLSLRLMQKTGYLTEAQAAEYGRIQERLEAGQIHFIESVKWITREDHRTRHPGNDFWDSLQSALQHQSVDLVPYVNASLWVISGNRLDPHTGKSIQVPLPFGLEPDWKRLHDRVRDPSKLQCELGRAAHEHAHEEFSALVSVAVAQKMQEAYIFGIPWEKVEFFLHSLDNRHTDAYRQWYPGAPEYCHLDDPDHCVFQVTLPEMLKNKRHRPSHYSAQIRGVLDLTRGKMSEIDAISLLLYTKMLHAVFLDYQYPSRLVLDEPIRAAHPVLMMQTGGFLMIRLAEMLKVHGIDPEENSPLLQYLFRQSGNFHPSWDEGQYPDLVDYYSALTQKGHRSVYMIYVTNLDAQMARRYPDYAATVLSGSLIHILKTLAPWAKSAAETVPMMRMLEASPMQFVFATFDAGLAAQFEALGPSESWLGENISQREEMQWQISRNVTGQSWSNRPAFEKTYYFKFSPRRIAEMGHPKAGAVSNAMERGSDSLAAQNWHGHFLMSEHVLF